MGLPSVIAYSTEIIEKLLEKLDSGVEFTIINDSGVEFTIINDYMCGKSRGGFETTFEKYLEHRRSLDCYDQSKTVISVKDR